MLPERRTLLLLFILTAPHLLKGELCGGGGEGGAGCGGAAGGGNAEPIACVDIPTVTIPRGGSTLVAITCGIVHRDNALAFSTAGGNKIWATSQVYHDPREASGTSKYVVLVEADPQLNVGDQVQVPYAVRYASTSLSSMTTPDAGTPLAEVLGTGEITFEIGPAAVLPVSFEALPATIQLGDRVNIGASSPDSSVRFAWFEYGFSPADSKPKLSRRTPDGVETYSVPDFDAVGAGALMTYDEPTSARTYHVIAWLPNGAAQVFSTQVAVEVANPVNVSIQLMDDPNPVRPTGGQVMLHANPSGGMAPYRFEWTPAGALTVSGDMMSAQAEISETTTYTVKIIDMLGATDMDALTVEVVDMVELRVLVTNGTGHLTSMPARIDCRELGMGVCDMQAMPGSVVRLIADEQPGSVEFFGDCAAVTPGGWISDITMDRRRTCNVRFMNAEPNELALCTDLLWPCAQEGTLRRNGAAPFRVSAACLDDSMSRCPATMVYSQIAELEWTISLPGGGFTPVERRFKDDDMTADGNLETGGTFYACSVMGGCTPPVGWINLFDVPATRTDYEVRVRALDVDGMLVGEAHVPLHVEP